MPRKEVKLRNDLTIIEVTTDRMNPVSESYSADRIAEKGPVRKPFKYQGKFYISSGGSSGGKVDPRRKEEAYQIVPRSEFKGDPQWYGRRIQPGDDDWAEQRRQQPDGFYHGMLVKHGQVDCVLVGPPLLFVEKEGTLPVKKLTLF